MTHPENRQPLADFLADGRDVVVTPVVLPDGTRGYRIRPIQPTPKPVTPLRVQRPVPPPRRPVPGRLWAALAGVALAVLGGIGWAIYSLVVLVTAHAGQVAAVALLILLALGAVGGGTCTTIVKVTHRH